MNPNERAITNVAGLMAVLPVLVSAFLGLVFALGAYAQAPVAKPGTPSTVEKAL